jgi:D-alanine-D-alanine ligase
VIDTHCHLDHCDAPVTEVLERARNAGLSRLATVGIDAPSTEFAIATAREHDPKVLVEAAIVGREVECAVLELPDGSVRASVPAEIRIVGAGPAGAKPEFYDFEAKYLDDVCEFDIPAKMDDAETERLREMAVAAFRALDGQGLARVDFFVGPDGAITVNEVNTMPGFTPISMYARAWAVTGLDFPTLLTTLVETALARGTGLR